MKLTTKYFKLSNNIFELGLKPNEFVVLAYISRCSNNNSKAFPSYNKIAEKCNIGLSTAKRVVNDLINKELLIKENRLTSDNKSMATNAYRLTEKVLTKKDTKKEIENLVEKPTTEEITKDIEETEELIKKFYNGEISIQEQNEQEELAEKIEVFQVHLNKKMSSNLIDLIKSLDWDEIVSSDIQINENKKEEYCTEKYIINAIYDNKRVAKLKLVK
ncbi:Uncharacterised protein [uncultured Clostridium sp.]|nr:Uncharacterised protein [uncultured Clostridium sp.]